MAAFTYTFKTPGLYKVSADVAGEVCEQLQNSEAGLSPATLLEASRSESAPLHGEFEWNDSEAAEKYRLHQAAGLIRNLTIVTKQNDGSRVADRAFVVTPGGESRYTALSHALSRQDLRDALLESARRDAKCYIAKYKRLTETAGITSAMEAFLNTPAV